MFVVALGVPISLLLGTFSPRLWIIGIAWLLFSAGAILVDALAISTRASLRVFPAYPNGLAVGQVGEASFQLAFSGSSPPAAVEVSIGTGPRLVALHLRQTVQIENRAGVAFFSLSALRRGQGRLECLWLRWQGPLGLVWVQKTEKLDKSIPIMLNIQAVKDEVIQLFRRDASVGSHIQLNAAHGAEFHALRDFQAGMDRRTIDWKQSAKHGLLLAKEFQAEQNHQIVMALDTGRLMSESLAGQARIDRALHAILLLSYVALRMGDRVGLFAFDEKPRLRSGTVIGPAAFSQLQLMAAGLDYSVAETNFTLGLTQLSADLKHRSIVVVFTDFVDTTSAELMIENVARLLQRHLVLFVLFRDVDLESLAGTRPSTPEDVARAVIADSLLRERNIVIQRLRRLGVEIIDAPLSETSIDLVRSYLAAKRLDRV